MPVSLCEWRVRIGRFVQWTREYEIIERKEKALKERTRLLKILHERLLKTKGDLEGKEEECLTKTNKSSDGETDDESGSEITNSSNPNEPLRENSCPTHSTVKESNTPAESTTKNMNSTFILLYFLLLLLLFSYFLFSLDDFLNLLESYEPLLKWSHTSFFDWIWLIGIISSVSACIMFRFVKKNIEESKGIWLEILHKTTPVGSVVKESRIPTISTVKFNKTPTPSTTISNKNSTRSVVNANKTRTEPAIKENNGYSKSTIKEDTTAIKENNHENATTESTNSENNTTSKSIMQDNNFPNQPVSKEDNTPKKFTTKMNTTPKKSSIKQNNTLKKHTCIIRESNTAEKSAIIENSINKNTNPSNFTIDDISTPKKSATKEDNAQKKPFIKNNDTPTNCKHSASATKSTTKKNNAPNKSSIKKNNATNKCRFKVDTTSKIPAIKDNSTPTQSTIKYNIPTHSTIKDNRTPTKSTIKDNGTPAEDTIKDNGTPTQSTIKDKGTPTQSTIKDNGTSTQSTIKDNCSPIQSTIKDDSTPTQSTIKDNGNHTQSTIKENGTPTQSTIKDNGTSTHSTTKHNFSPTQSTIKDDSTPTQSTINEIGTRTQSIIKGNDTPTESTIKDNGTPAQSTIKDDSTPTQSTMNENGTRTQSTFKGNDTPTQSTIEDTGPPTQSTIKDNGTPTQSTIKENGTPTQSTVKDNSTPTLSSTKHNDVSIQSTIKDNGTPTQSVIKHKRTPTISTKKHNITPAHATIKDGGTPSQSTIKDNNTPTQSTSKDTSTPTQATIKDYSTHRKEKNLETGAFVTEKAREDYTKKRNANWTKQLLIQAGDVELNPGPFERSIGRLQERELLSLAHDVSPEYYYTLCIALGFSQALSKSILSKNHLEVSASIFEILCKWRMKQIDGFSCRRDLVDILRREDLNELANKISQGTYDSRESIPAGDRTQPLTREQVDRCGEDFKIFYRTRLCKIKTDPLDFNSVLEFEKIYTNLVLLRNEMGTTRKTPLDYNDLLTTKVNGVLPKRLMAEGEGGAGKTTLCSKIAWDWSSGDQEFQEFDWVLVIPLREVDGNQTVGDIARTYLSDSNPAKPCQIEEYILANPSKVFIIFDGLDEYDGDLVQQETDIAKIIRSEKYTECRVLVTTRPWKADQVKSNRIFARTYAFIAVTGFDEKHISIYIKKYFSDDPQAGRELIRLIKSNDVIKENMAPFPIYIAMLCVLWRDSDREKRELIRRLKTFSQLFNEIITFLKDHYVSKHYTDLKKEIVNKAHEQFGIYFTKIGQVALSGVMNNKLVFAKNDFNSCEEAVETCCRVGVLSQENRIVRRRDRHKNATHPMTLSVFFPHKLFQEYLAGVYLADLFESDRESYKVKISGLFRRTLEEFRYLLYFTAAQSKEVGLDITNRLLNESTCYQGAYTACRYNKTNMLVDVTFEAYDEDVAKAVGHHTFAQQESLEISDNVSAHTVSGYLFIMEKKEMKTLVLSRGSCGSTVSRDLADIICSSMSLAGLDICGTRFHADFYGILDEKIKESKLKRLSIERMDTPDEVQSRNLAKFVNNLPCLNDLKLRANNFHECFYTELALWTGSVANQESRNSICRLLIDHRFCDDILQHGLTVEKLFPKLEELFFATLHTVSPSIIGSLAHSSLKVISLVKEDQQCKRRVNEAKEYHPSLVGDPPSLEQVFSNSFPRLTDLTFKDLVMGNNRCESILLSLKQHRHLKDIRVIHCYTDEEIDPIASTINMEKRMNVKLQHDQGQKCLECYQMSSGLADALCHRTSVQELILTEETKFDNAWFANMKGRTVDSKIQKLTMKGLDLEKNDPSASRDLARFLCLQPCLTDLKTSSQYNEYGVVELVWLHDEFYHEIARHASLSKIQKLTLEGFNLLKNNDPSASRDLARFLCLQPGLTDVKTTGHYDCGEGCDARVCLHDEFYHEIARLSSSSKIQKLTLEGLNLLEKNDPSASRDLARFLCLLPCLTYLKITGYYYDDFSRDARLCLHNEFYHEIALLASSSKVQKLTLEGLNLIESNIPSASHDLARFLCLQPCLTDVKITGYYDDDYGHDARVCLHDEFYHEIARLASSSENPFFKNNVTWKTWYNEHRTGFDPQYALSQPSQTINSAVANPSESLLQEQSCHQQYHTQLETMQSLQLHSKEPHYSSRLSESDTLDTLQCATSPVHEAVSFSLSLNQMSQEAAYRGSSRSNKEFAHSSPEVPIKSESWAQQHQLEPPIPQGTEIARHYMGEQDISQATFQPSHGRQEFQAWSNQESTTSHSVDRLHAQYSPHAPSNLQAPFGQSSQSLQLYSQHHIRSLNVAPLQQFHTLQGEWSHATQNRAGEGLPSFQPPRERYYPVAFPSPEPPQSSQPWSTQAPSQTIAFNQLSQMSAIQRIEQPNQMVQHLAVPSCQQYQLQPPQNYLLSTPVSHFPPHYQPCGEQFNFSQRTHPPQLINTQEATINPNQHQPATSAGILPLPGTNYYYQHQQSQPRHIHLSHPSHPVQTPISQNTISYISSQTSGGPQQPYTPPDPRLTFYHPLPRHQQPR